MSFRTNTVIYSPGHAPIGEMRELSIESYQVQPPVRGGRKKQTPNQAKLMFMRKCKR